MGRRIRTYLGETTTMTTSSPSAEPSLLLQAFTRYLRNRPADDDTESIRSFNEGQALEGISGSSGSLGGVPTVTLEPLVGKPKRTVVYYHGGGYISGSPPDRYPPVPEGTDLHAPAGQRP